MKIKHLAITILASLVLAFTIALPVEASWVNGVGHSTSTGYWRGGFSSGCSGALNKRREFCLPSFVYGNVEF